MIGDWYSLVSNTLTDLEGVHGSLYDTYPGIGIHGLTVHVSICLGWVSQQNKGTYPK